MPGADPYIGAAADLGTTLVSSAYNYYQQRENRAWQERMMNSAHQREMRDLRRAGINPIMTALGGSGAGTPSVPAPQADLAAPWTGAASSAARLDLDRPQAVMAMHETAGRIEKLSAETENLRLQQGVIGAQEQLLGAERLLKIAQTSAAEGDAASKQFRKELYDLAHEAVVSLKEVFGLTRGWKDRNFTIKYPNLPGILEGTGKNLLERFKNLRKPFEAMGDWVGRHKPSVIYGDGAEDGGPHAAPGAW